MRVAARCGADEPQVARVVQAAGSRCGREEVDGGDGSRRGLHAMAGQSGLCAATGWPGWRSVDAGAAERDAAEWAALARPQARAVYILIARLYTPCMPSAAAERLRRLGVADVLGAERWEECRETLKLFRGLGALACAKSWLNARATTRRMHDTRPLPCPLGCVDQEAAHRGRHTPHCAKFCGRALRQPSAANQEAARETALRSAPRSMPPSESPRLRAW